MGHHWKTCVVSRYNILMQNCILFLLQHKESSNSTAFHLACTQGSLEIVKRLHNEDGEIIELNMTDDHDMTPLHRAAASNRPQIASFLIEKVMSGCQVWTSLFYGVGTLLLYRGHEREEPPARLSKQISEYYRQLPSKVET